MTPTATLQIDQQRIRDQFPTLAAGPDVYLDNAGGSQVPHAVADAIRDYMLTSYVQLGADYATSKTSTETIERAHDFTESLMGAGDAGKVALASSTTSLCQMLADCYARAFDAERNVFVLSEQGHEANVGPWARLADRGWEIRWWRADPETGAVSRDDLNDLLDERVRILAFPHVSNLLGDVLDVRAITKAAHDVGARVVVDDVAYAPHRAMAVADWGVDWCIYSTYKVYGPHMAAMFGMHKAYAELEGPNHFFIPKDAVPYKFEPGGCSHEGCAGLLALGDYLSLLAGERGQATRATVEKAFAAMTALELPLQKRLIEYLRTRDDVRIIGPERTDDSRVATISFVHRTKSSREIAVAANERGLGIRYGHFYAHRLATALGLDPEDGVVRTSLVHYNTMEEVERLIRFFDEAL